MKIKLIDKQYYISPTGWNTVFADKAGALTDAEWERYNFLASTRIKNIVNKYFQLLTDLDPKERDAVQQAVAIMIDYWLEYGINLNRISGSVSLGGYSVSENVPADPDYIPDMVYEVLETVGLYTYAGLGYNNCDAAEFPEHYQWNGLKYPFKFSVYANNYADLIKETKLPEQAYAYVKENQHWYVFKDGAWKDLGEFTIKGDIGQAGKSFEYKGRVDTVNDLPKDATLDEAYLVNDSGELWIMTNEGWRDIGPFSSIVQKGHFRVVNKEGKDVLEPLHSYPIIMEDVSGKEIINNSPFMVTTRRVVDDKTVATNFDKLKHITPISFSTDVSGGPVKNLEHFGDLDNKAQRDNFMENVNIGEWYTFLIGTAPYLAVVTSGNKTTNYQWTGYRIITGATGKTVEIVNGSTSSTGHGETVSSFTGDAFSSSLNIPSAYSVLQYLPKDVIVQMISDAIAPLSNDETDPTWRDLDGTQATTFTPSKITIVMTDSGILEGENIQFLLGSTLGNLVLNEAIKVYETESEAKINKYVAGQYNWYVWTDGTDTTFVMNDTASALTDTTQVVAKVRRVAPKTQSFTGHYTSQAGVLTNSTTLLDVAKGASKIVTLPTGITIDTMTQVGLSVSGTTDWITVSGWDKATPFYSSVMTEDTGNTWWIEYKFEVVPGDKTKIKITNEFSGNQNDASQAYKAHWLHIKGGL